MKKRYLFKIGKIRVLPFATLKYFIVFLLVFALMFAYLMRESSIFKSYVGTGDWDIENHKIRCMLAEKYLCSPYNELIAQRNYQHGKSLLSVVKNDEVVIDYPLLKIRDTELDKSLDKKTNIVIVGDSLVWGHGYSNSNYTFWSQLETELLRRGYDCNVYAVGMGGLNSLDELEIITKTSMLEDLDADLVIIGYYQNDYNIESTDFSVPDFDEDALANYEEKIVKPLKLFSDGIDIPITVQTLPLTPNKQFLEYYTPIADLYNRYGIPAYECTEAFCNSFDEEKHSDNYMANPGDNHPGTASSYFYAQYIADWIEADYPDILEDRAVAANAEYNVKINDWLPYSLRPQEIESSETQAVYSITYPEASDKNTYLSDFLYMPLKENYVRVNFKYPVDITNVSVACENMLSSKMWITVVDDNLGYDDQTIYELGSENGKEAIYSDSEIRYVTSLLISAELSDGKSGDIIITVNCENGGVRL